MIIPVNCNTYKPNYTGFIGKKDSQNFAKDRNRYLARIYKPPVKSKILNFIGTVSTALLTYAGICAGYEFYNNSYKEYDRRGYIDYVEPEQSKFNTRESALKYASARIINALNNKNPHEYMVYVDNKTNEILAEFRGDSSSVNGILSLWDKIKVTMHKKGFSALHGHPQNGDGSTNVFSGTDFKALAWDPNMIELTAVNKSGEFSRMRKKPYYVPLDSSIVNGVIKEIKQIKIKSFRNTQPKAYKKLIWEHNSTTDSLEKKRLMREFYEIVEKQDSTLYTIRALDKFWRKKAEKFRMEYFTDFKQY